jgi:serine/threonine protein kinase
VPVDYARELEAMAKFLNRRVCNLFRRCSPNLTQNFCFIQSDGQYESSSSIFIPMEYLEHEDLQKYIIHPYPQEEAQEITAQLLEGIAFMHDNGFAHRDVKLSIQQPDKPLHTLRNKRNRVHWSIILMGSICIVIVSVFSSTLVTFIRYIVASLPSPKDPLIGNNLNA